MGEWTLTVGNINVEFLSTKSGSLGVKFNSSKETGHVKYFVPLLKKDKEIPKYNPKNPQKDFVDVRYTDGNKYLRADEIVKKYYEKDKPEVLISVDKMKEMHPLTKKAKVISKQPLSKINLRNVSASDGYYLLPRRDFENIQKYKKVVEYIGDDFVITSPIRLRVGSVTQHNYAIFVDKRKNALVAIEVLVKAGMQPEPEV